MRPTAGQTGAALSSLTQGSEDGKDWWIKKGLTGNPRGADRNAGEDIALQEDDKPGGLVSHAPTASADFLPKAASILSGMETRKVMMHESMTKAKNIV